VTPSIILIVTTIFNDEFSTYEIDGKFSVRKQEMPENLVSEVKKNHVQNICHLTIRLQNKSIKHYY